MPKISPLADVHPEAVVAPDNEVGPFCVVGPGVTLGPGNRLVSHVALLGNTTVGAGNTFFPHTALGAAPQDKKFKGEPTRLEIGDHNQFRENVTVHVGTEKGGGVTRVGSHNLLMVNAHVGHDAAIGDHCILANNVMVAGHVVIGNHVALMGGVGLHHFVTLGDLAYIGGYARIHHDVPPFCKVEGADQIRGINSVGMRRTGHAEPDIEAVERAVRALFYNRKRSFAATMAEVDANVGTHPLVRLLIDFLRRRDLGRHGRYLESTRVK